MAVDTMTVILDKEITTRVEMLVPQLVASKIKYELLSDMSFVENTITFKREMAMKVMGDNAEFQAVSKFQQEDQLMVLIESDRLVTLVDGHLKKETADDDVIDLESEEEESLIPWVETVKELYPGKKITLLLYNTEKYFKKVKQITQKEYRNRILHGEDGQPQKKKGKNKNADIPVISKTELQSALIELQLHTGVNYKFIKDAHELGTAITKFVKAIAEAPFKRQKVELQGFDWFALSDCAGSVKVEKDGSGLRKLWADQITQFNKVGSDIANAIVAKYPSPKSLINAYEKCNTVDEGHNLLQGISVTTGVGPLARTRKVGPEVSKRMYRFFNSTNGDRFLGNSDMR